MKYWLSHLPLEVWVDCYRYPGITREQMGKIVDLIGNRTYGEYLQFYLHDWGKRKLKPIFFYKRASRKKKPNRDWRPHMRIPRTALPANIKGFEYIRICHFDQQTIDFLRRIHPLLQADLKLKLDHIPSRNLGNLRVLLDNMLPLLGRIDTLFCTDMRALPTVGQCFGEKLARIKTLVLYHEGYIGFGEALRQSTVNFLMDWLTSPQHEQEGAVERCGFANFIMGAGFIKQISAAIREEFLAAKTPKTFTLVVNSLFEFAGWEFAEFHLENGIGEELHGVKFEEGIHIQFTRQKANCGGADVQDWLKENASKLNDSQSHRKSQIEIRKPTIGLIDGMDAPESVEEEQQQPSISKCCNVV